MPAVCTKSEIPAYLPLGQFFIILFNLSCQCQEHKQLSRLNKYILLIRKNKMNDIDVPELFSP